MTAAVRITSILVDPSPINELRQQLCAVRLACGCSWWEDHAEQDAPQVGSMVVCFVQHTASTDVV